MDHTTLSDNLCNIVNQPIIIFALKVAFANDMRQLLNRAAKDVVEQNYAVPQQQQQQQQQQPPPQAQSAQSGPNATN